MNDKLKILTKTIIFWMMMNQFFSKLRLINLQIQNE